MRKYYFIFITFLTLGISANAQEASAILDHNEIKIGEQTTIDLEFSCPASVKEIMMPELKDTISKFVEIIKISEIDTTFDEDDISKKIFTQKITITSWDSGFHAIPPFVYVIGGETIKTKALLLKVNTVPIQAEQDIKDIKPIIEVPFSLWDWILSNRLVIGTIILIILVIVVAIILYRKYRNRPIEEKQIIVPKEAADLVANRKLAELEGKKYWQAGKVKAYYSDLSFIIREYLENRFDLGALELTTDEIISLLASNAEVSSDMKDKLQDVLMLADMAKFAKQQPVASENETALRSSYLFIGKTAMKEPLVTDTEESENNVKGEENA